MSGHSKWSSIKHKKAIVDSRRGAQFTKLARAVTVAAREGGGDPDANAALENAIRKAKAASMPKDNIERAIAKGTGEGGDADALETVVYEGYGPGGVALLVETVTDNRNRTGPDVRNLFTKFGGSLGEPGSVAYLFDKKGVILVDARAGGSDTPRTTCSSPSRPAPRTSPPTRTSSRSSPRWATSPRCAAPWRRPGSSWRAPSSPTARRASCRSSTRARSLKLMKLIDALEENDDVSAVHANFDAPAEVLERVAG